MNDMLTTNDLHLIDSEPRVLDLRIAERLGMADPHDIRRTIETNKDELERYGEVSGRRPETGAKGGRPATEYWLNEAQTLLLCMFSRTDAAADVRQEVISVYMAYRQGRQPAKSTTTKLPNVEMEFKDYSDMMRALIAGTLALEKVNNLRRSDIYREDRGKLIEILIANTSLSDEEIAQNL